MWNLVNGNRRRGARYEVRVQASVSVAGKESSLALVGRPPAILGHTSNISAEGLGLIVPSLRIDDFNLTELNHTLRIMLALPAGYVEIYAVLVHYSRVGEDEMETGFQIGLKIEEMSDADRDLYKDYLRTLR